MGYLTDFFLRLFEACTSEVYLLEATQERIQLASKVPTSVQDMPHTEVDDIGSS